MSYPLQHFPFRFRRLSADGGVVVGETGDFLFVSNDELKTLAGDLSFNPTELLGKAKARFLIGDPSSLGTRRLMVSRIAARRETILSGPALHMIVPTLYCGHSCRYCQVSRSQSEIGYSMSEQDLDIVCDTIFQSPAPALTIEFQGGDPLLRFDLVRRAIDRISERNVTHDRRLRFVVASTLHQLDEKICEFLSANGVFLSTSIDGPAFLHNSNRPLPTKDSFQRTVAGIKMARALIGQNSVSALMTTTKAALSYPNEIVDEYVALELPEIFIRPINCHGFSRRKKVDNDYTVEEFFCFYTKALERVIEWNKRGISIREATAALALNKILSPHDAGYVDLQSPTGAGLSALMYHYDGFVYPSDEARMLAETGDSALRLGRIGAPISELLKSPVQRALIRNSLSRSLPDCEVCSYNGYCGPDPIDSYRQWGSMSVPASRTDHCQKQRLIFDHLFRKLREGNHEFAELAYDWATPCGRVGAPS